MSKICKICGNKPSILDIIDGLCLGCYFKNMMDVPNYIPSEQYAKWIIENYKNEQRKNKV